MKVSVNLVRKVCYKSIKYIVYNDKPYNQISHNHFKEESVERCF